jgi:hypothetical protein
MGNLLTSSSFASCLHSVGGRKRPGGPRTVPSAERAPTLVTMVRPWEEECSASWIIGVGCRAVLRDNNQQFTGWEPLTCEGPILSTRIVHMTRALLLSLVMALGAPGLPAFAAEVAPQLELDEPGEPNPDSFPARFTPVPPQALMPVQAQEPAPKSFKSPVVAGALALTPLVIMLADAALFVLASDLSNYAPVYYVTVPLFFASPGLGHFYAGAPARGLLATAAEPLAIILGGCAGLGIANGLPRTNSNGILIVFEGVAVGIGVLTSFVAFDAYRSAERHNQEESSPRGASM